MSSQSFQVESPESFPSDRKDQRKEKLRAEIRPLNLKIDLAVPSPYESKSPGLIPIPQAKLRAQVDSTEVLQQLLDPLTPGTAHNLTLAPHLSLTKDGFSPLPPLTPNDSESIFGDMQLAYLDSLPVDSADMNGSKNSAEKEPAVKEERNGME